MEKICDDLRDFLINDLGPYLEDLEDSTVSLPEFTEKNCVCNAIDFGRYQMPQVCFILPDIQIINELTMDDNEESTTVDVFVFCSGKPSDILYKQALRYGAAIKKLCKEKYNMNDECTQINVTQFEFFEDVGANDKRMTGIKLSLTILTEE